VNELAHSVAVDRPILGYQNVKAKEGLTYVQRTVRERWVRRRQMKSYLRDVSIHTTTNLVNGYRLSPLPDDSHDKPSWREHNVVQWVTLAGAL